MAFILSSSVWGSVLDVNGSKPPKFLEVGREGGAHSLITRDHQAVLFKYGV